jgi:hypothetical protein
MRMISQLTGRAWDEPIALAERRISAQLARAATPAADVEFPEAELHESLRRAAILRERQRRLAARRA